MYIYINYININVFFEMLYSTRQYSRAYIIINNVYSFRNLRLDNPILMFVLPIN